MELKKWFRLTAMLPLIFVFVFTNVYQDPASLYHDYTRQVAKKVIAGYEVFLRSGNGDERGVKQHMIEYMPKYIECVTIGPSLSMGVRNSNVGTESHYNLSASNLNFNDFMAEFALLELNNIKFDRVIFCVDLFFFDKTFATVSHKPEWMPYTNYMISRLDGKDMDPPKEDTDSFSIEKLIAKCNQFRQALSITYFQAAWNLIQKNGKYIQESRWGVVDESTADYTHYMPDGSWMYSLEYRNSTVDDVIEEANSYDIETRFANGRHLNEQNKEYFDKLVEYLIGNEVEVEFFLCPLCPTLWDRLETDSPDCQYYILDEIETHVNEIAEKFDIKVTGSYNPYIVGISDEDFWDSRHIRHDRLDDFFDFKE